ncbi:Hypothetical predicted protein [Marmota monax]|uniref:Uncharacterized protein n=1 Tax=Marmota monax TaxID=9995 RepID=A0A5E4BXA9_MARMO|nr:hypothetical protein GHT09_013087 [Marmota monax]VTJ74244.1 Hypothetical predicted protein [Marmota monax]
MANKRPGRPGSAPRPRDWCPRPAQACSAAPRLSYPEPRPSQPQPRRRAGDPGPAHAADSRQRRAGLSSGPAPGRSRRPLLKDRRAARRTKPARGQMQSCTANLFSRYSGVTPSRPIGGQAGPRCYAPQRLRCSAAPARVLTASRAARPALVLWAWSPSFTFFETGLRPDPGR